MSDEAGSAKDGSFRLRPPKRGTSSTVSDDRRFDGWLVVGAVFLLFVTNAGLGFYGLAIYLDAIIEEQDFSNSSVSLATSMFFLVAALVGRAIARPVEAGYIRQLVIAGGLLCGLSLIALGQVEQVWQLYAVYLVFAVGFALAGIIPGTTLVTRWFHVRRSVALAVASSGLSVGGLTLTQLASWLIRRNGLSDAAPTLGVAFVVLVLVASVCMWPDPEARRQAPDGGHRRTPGAGAPAAAATVSYEQAVGSRFFWTTTIGFFFAMSAQVGSIAHMASLGTDRVDRGTGALAVLSLALASAGFRLLGGVVAARVPMAGLTIGCAFVQGLSQILIAESDSRAMIVVAAFIMGATVGNLLMLQALLVAEAFGVAAYARVFSLNQLIVTVGVATGPFLLGGLEDVASYRLSFWVAGSLSIIASAVFTVGGSVAGTQRKLTAPTRASDT